MSNNYLYSVVLDLHAVKAASIPATMGHQTHALFLDLISQVDPALAMRGHEEPGYRPFTVSLLEGVPSQDNRVALQPGQSCHLRVTLLDGGALWDCLHKRFLTTQPILLRLGEASLKVDRMLSHPADDSTGWAGYVDWQTVAATEARRSITLRFASPTAFSMGKRQFVLFPEPDLVWYSLVRVWNTYAPEVLQIEKEALQKFIKSRVMVSDSSLHITTLHYPTHPQKGFVGTCRYRVRGEGKEAAQLAALAEFARYAGVGSKTTMGMGQVRAEDSNVIMVKHGKERMLENA
jgi:CRISPR-associated endoribonuclease Cas6